MEENDSIYFFLFFDIYIFRHLFYDPRRPITTRSPQARHLGTVLVFSGTVHGNLEHGRKKAGLSVQGAMEMGRCLVFGHTMEGSAEMLGKYG